MLESAEDKNRDDELKEIFSDFKQKKQESSQAEKIESKKLLFSTKTRKFFIVLGLGICLSLSFYLLVLVFGKSSPFQSPEPWAIGQRFPSDNKIDGCIFRLWQIKRSVDLYYSENKSFPENMEQLYDGEYLKRGFVCPACNKEYIFVTKDNKKVFACPEPHAHNHDIISIYCRVINSPPVIER
ncbi:MAG: hypothetical protein V1747_04975 [Candidatus Omnitrophota bacterium]